MKVRDIFPIRSLVSFISYETNSTHITATAASSEAALLVASLAIAKESLCCLWYLNEDSAFEFSAGAEIHVVGLSLTSGSSLTGGFPGLKPFFRKKFDPKESTIAAFITIYEAAMRRATLSKKGTISSTVLELQRKN